MLLKTRDRLVKERTMLISVRRGHASEFGIIAARSVVTGGELAQRAQAEAAGRGTGTGGRDTGVPAGRIENLAARIPARDAELTAPSCKPGAVHT